MALSNVIEYFKDVNLDHRIVTHDIITDTVIHAAQVIGCQPAQIMKTMSFYVKEDVVLIAMAGDAKISNPKYRAQFHQKAKMIPSFEVLSCVGHNPGGVCPFAVKDNIKVYLDISLKRFYDVHAAAGDAQSTINLTIDELVKHSNMIDWIDVGKDWE